MSVARWIAAASIGDSRGVAAGVAIAPRRGCVKSSTAADARSERPASVAPSVAFDEPG